MYSCTKHWFPHARSRSQPEVGGQVIYFHYLKKTTEASLFKLHEKVNNNEIVCHIKIKVLCPSQGHTEKKNKMKELMSSARLGFHGCVQGHSQGSDVI